MDRILSSLVDDLLNKQEILRETDDNNFEYFSNYVLVTEELKKDFDLSIVNTGSGDDTGIDGIAIIINGQFVESTDDVEYFAENFEYFDVTYIFIQTKNTNKFEGKEINNFSFGLMDFFSDRHKLRRNENIEYVNEISNLVFAQAPKFNHNPVCKLFYVTTGTYQIDQNNEAIKNTTIETLMSLNLFSSVSFSFLGSNELIKIYRNLNNKVSVPILFQERVTLPEIDGIKESFLGIIPLSEFSKLIVDENNNLRNIFYDNIRDFQGLRNPVNTQIEKTLKTAQPEIFTILNNGITVVANDLKSTGNKFTVIDYQIVNGCQTSNVLYEYIKNTNYVDFTIPLKLIVTSNEDIKNKITIATNSQTAIKHEQLQAMTDFQKNLEQYYTTTQGDTKLYYERRTGQYQTDNTIIKARIINIQNQIKSFSTFYYENPDRVTTYFGYIVKQFIEVDNPKIFNEQHQLLLYYTAGLAYYRLETFFKSKILDSKYRKIKFFVLMLFRKLIQKEMLLQTYMNSTRKVDEYCNPIILILEDRVKSIDYFSKAIDIIDKSGQDINDKQLIKQTIFTTSLIDTYKKYY